MPGDDVRVGRGIVIRADEIELSFTPSGGPGGQHANRSATRVELTWNVDRSRALSTRQKAAVKERLRARLDAAGNLRLTSAAHRSQTRNRAEVTERLARVVRDALTPRRTRIPTRATAASHEKRLQAKKRRSETKRLRRADH